MTRRNLPRGFSLIEVLVAVAIFLLFAVGVYGATSLVFNVVYRSRITVLETALLSEELEVARNLSYSNIGVVGSPVQGVLVANKVVMRDGIKFSVTTTVQNKDDPYDMVAPSDTSPADYKLIEIAAQCLQCMQHTPISLSARIGPKGLEGATGNGALFINVFDAAGQPVSGASVHVSNVSTTPQISYDDVTDVDGYLRIVDTPTGTANYQISVSKSGYSFDGTVTATAAYLNPIKPPANVITQNVTDISFSIDKLADLTVHTQNAACVGIGNVGFRLKGTKSLSRSPDVYKYDTTYTTDGSGNKALGLTEWDTYDTSLTGNGYDIMGSIPIDPFYLIPGSTQDVILILKAHTSNSLLVKVIDAATKLPISNASVRVVGSGYDTTLLTGVGYIRQTDWSGGSGITNFVEGRYVSSTSLTVNNPAGDVILTKTGSVYASAGQLVSGTFDFGTTVNLQNLVLSPTTQPAQTGLQPLVFQIATSSVASPSSWRYTGPDGKTNTFYTMTSTQIFVGASPTRYVRYRATLSTANTSYTPRLSEIAFTYTDACTPPGQAFFESLSASSYDVTVTAPGYQDASSTIAVSGRSDILFNLAD